IGGIMSLTGEPDGEPMKVGVAIVDVTAGLYALGAILAALRARDRDGVGQRVEVSLFQSQLAWLINAASAYLVARQPPRRHRHPPVGDVPLVRWPFELSETPAALRHAPPLLGQHTDELLAELGLTPDELAALRADGAI